MKPLNQDLELLRHYRGKRLIDGKWTYGTYVYHESCIHRHWINDLDLQCEIDANTLCRPVRIGDKIYHEGDIFALDYEDSKGFNRIAYYVITWNLEYAKWCLVGAKSYASGNVDRHSSLLNYLPSDEYTHAGNIFDNSELMEKK